MQKLNFTVKIKYFQVKYFIFWCLKCWKFSLLLTLYKQCFRSCWSGTKTDHQSTCHHSNSRAACRSHSIGNWVEPALTSVHCMWFQRLIFLSYWNHLVIWIIKKSILLQCVQGCGPKCYLTLETASLQRNIMYFIAVQRYFRVFDAVVKGCSIRWFWRVLLLFIKQLSVWFLLKWSLWVMSHLNDSAHRCSCISR